MASFLINFFLKLVVALLRIVALPGALPVVDDADYRVGHALWLEPVSDDQVLHFVHEMRGGSAPGRDNISPSTLKDNIDHMIKQLTHIVNQVFRQKYVVEKCVKCQHRVNLGNFQLGFRYTADTLFYDK